MRRYILMPCLIATVLLFSFPAWAGPTGVLLGLRVDHENGNGNYEPPSYYTLWIEADNGQIAREKRALEYLLVPRPDGFWTVTSEPVPYPGVYLENYMFHQVGGSGMGSANFLSPWTEGDIRGCELDIKGRILAVSGDTITMERSEYYMCQGSVHPNYATSLRIAALSQPDAVLEPFGYGLALDGQAMLRYGRNHPLEQDDPDFAMCDPDYDDLIQGQTDPLDWSWGMAHIKGRWTLIGRVNFSHGVSACDRTFLIPMSTPKPLAPLNSGPEWEQVRKTFPQALDFVASPRGDMLLVVEQDALYAYPVRESGTGDPVKVVSLSNGAAVVMAEWAYDASVSRWAGAFQTAP